MITLNGIGKHAFFEEFSVLYFMVDGVEWQDTVLLGMPAQDFLSENEAKYQAEIAERAAEYTGEEAIIDPTSGAVSIIQMSLEQHMKSKPKGYDDLSKLKRAKDEAAIWAIKQAAADEHASDVIKDVAEKLK